DIGIICPRIRAAHDRVQTAQPPSRRGLLFAPPRVVALRGTEIAVAGRSEEDAMRHFVCVLLLVSCEAQPEVATRSEPLTRDQALRQALLTAGEQHRVLTFDASAALIRAIVSANEHLVPNSPEIDAPQVHESPHVRLQRAENLITGATRY